MKHTVLKLKNNKSLVCPEFLDSKVVSNTIINADPEFKEDIDSRTHYPEGVTFEDVDHSMFIEGGVDKKGVIVLVIDPVERVKLALAEDPEATVDSVLDNLTPISHHAYDSGLDSARTITYVDAKDTASVTALVGVDVSADDLESDVELSEEDVVKIKEELKEDVEIYESLKDGVFEARVGEVVPEKVSSRQFKLQLNKQGDYQTIDSIVRQQPMDIQIEWDNATEFRRDWDSLIGMQQYLEANVDPKWDEVYLDELFIKASKL